MTQVELQQAKERFLKLVELAAGGGEIIISRDKQPLVKLPPSLSKNNSASLAVPGA